ncbi:MAG TPA: hypothetical protein VKU92_07220 [Acidimicrobiales bacterium]|nr:hypothetical protein [Acidimicrobiales bacterium]
MRAVVVGSLPPPITERSRSLLAEVLRLRREGCEVEVVSPRADTVAHRYLELPGPAAALELGLACRGADRVVVQLEPGFPAGDQSGRAGRALGLGAIALVLAYKRSEVVIRLHSIHDLPRGAGGRAAESLWAVADRIDAGSEETFEQLVSSVPAAHRAKLQLATEMVALGGDRSRSADLGAGASYEAVTDLVRARAAEARMRVLSAPGVGAAPTRGPARVPLWQWQPVPGAGVPPLAQSLSNERAHGTLARRMARAALVAAEEHPATRPAARAIRRARRLVARSIG